jgi:hypothetical protein
MKILAKGQTVVNSIHNNTDKTKNVVLRDGREVIVAQVTLSPDLRVRLDMSFSRDVRISGQGSRGAYFDGYFIKWRG